MHACLLALKERHLACTAIDRVCTGVALGDLDGGGTVATVDADGLPNVNQDGLLNYCSFHALQMIEG